MLILSNFEELKSKIVRRTSIYFNFSEISLRDELKFRWQTVHDYQKNNAFLTITNRFFKYVKLISKTESFSTTIWVERYWKSVYKFWKNFHRIVFDRDSKFTSKFWRELFNKYDVKLNFITTYHSFANNQAKKFNQIVKIAFRCLLIK